MYHLSLAFGLSFTILMFSGCMSAANHSKSLQSTHEAELTVGIVQRDIHVGMSASEVAKALGSPNIVTKDSENFETWIYDKIATQASYSNSSGGIGVSGVGVPSSIILWGWFNGAARHNAGASSTMQKTLTVVIKFNDQKKVKTFSYHSSKF